MMFHSSALLSAVLTALAIAPSVSALVLNPTTRQHIGQLVLDEHTVSERLSEFFATHPSEHTHPDDIFGSEPSHAEDNEQDWFPSHPAHDSTGSNDDEYDDDYGYYDKTGFSDFPSEPPKMPDMPKFPGAPAGRRPGFPAPPSSPPHGRPGSGDPHREPPYDQPPSCVPHDQPISCVPHDQPISCAPPAWRLPQMPSRPSWRGGFPSRPPRFGMPDRFGSCPSRPHPPPPGHGGKCPGDIKDPRRPGSRFPHWHHHGLHPPSMNVHSNLTVYEMLGKSRFTTKIFALIKEDEELVKLLNSTKHNVTFFAPTNRAFEKIPQHHHNSSDGHGNHTIPKEFLRALLEYHAVPGEQLSLTQLYFHDTLPSGLISAGALGKGEAQRLRVSASFFRGVRINFLSKVVAGDFYGTNGVVHGIDSIILPPPEAATILSILPGEFSTTAFALLKTGLVHELPKGAKTIFAPGNSAWRSLGFKINAFLFSPMGEKYLAALLKYHVVPGWRVYSDYVYEEDKDKDDDGDAVRTDSWFRPGRPSDYKHLDLPTLLGDKKIAVDITRGHGWTKWRVNGRVPVFLHDIPARDAAVQVPLHVLIPPHPSREAHRGDEEDERDVFAAMGGEEEEIKMEKAKLARAQREKEEQEEEKELTVEALKERLRPYL